MNQMKCEQAEIFLCDYLDGTLDHARRDQLDTHMQGCAACAAMKRDVEAAMGFVAEAAPHGDNNDTPAELLPRILFHLPSAPKMPERAPWWRNWFGPLMQPRFVMGMAMTVVSFSMIGRLVGIEPRQLTLADLEPTKVVAALDWKAHRIWDRAVKYYDNLRLVYDIQTRLEEWTAAEDQEQQNQSRGATIDLTPGNTSDQGRERK
jgi:anti-sigma factor RsiW